MAQIVKFSGKMDYDSIGLTGFVETTGVEITPVTQCGVTLLNPLGPVGVPFANCRLAVMTSAIPEVIAALAKVMVDEMQFRKTREMLEVTPEDGVGEIRPIPPHDLELMYGIGGSCPDYPYEDWLYEVRNDDTRMGYWEWVSDRLHETALDQAS